MRALALLHDRAALPILSARKSRGGVVNVSSSSAYQGFAYNAVYASTKAYNHVMSQTLAAEERGKVEQMLTEALLKLEGEFAGEYFPLEPTCACVVIG